ncbi:hypothetical protein IJ818_01220 [bacterium]|nr:hypothetical protein [bacterium]
MTTVSSVNPFKPADEQETQTKKKPAASTQDIDIYGNSTTTDRTTASSNGNVGLVSDAALNNDADMGLSIQRTTTNTAASSAQPEVAASTKKPAVSTAQPDEQTSAVTSSKKTKKPTAVEIAADDPVWAQNAARNKESKKPSFTRTLETFYGKKYTEASAEEKEKLAVKYFDWIRSDKKGTISQSRQFELYKSRCESAEEYEFLCSVIDKMEPDQQARAVRSVTMEGTDGQRVVGIASAIHDLDNYAEDAVPEIKEIILGAHGQLSPRHKIALTDLAYQDVLDSAQNNPDGRTQKASLVHSMEMDISRDERFSREDRIAHGRRAQTLTQYAYTEQQQALIDAGYDSEFKEVREATAEQTKTYDKSVQEYSVNRGLELEDEDIANIFARDVYSYDESVRENIINTLNNSGYDSVKETLKESKAQYEAEQKAKGNDTESRNTSSNDKTSKTSTSSSALAASAQRINKIVKNTSLNTTQKAKQIKVLAPKEQQAAIGQMIESATLPEIKSLVLSGLKTEVISYLLDNYTPESRSTLEELSPMMTPAEKTRYEHLISNYSGILQSPAAGNFFVH